MIAKVKVTHGGSDYQFEIEEKSEKETLNKAITFGNPPKECSLCKSDNVLFTTNKDKEGNIYVNVKCEGCGARSKLGEYKTGGFFWHDFEKYVPKDSQSANSE